ncbi:CMRF35-like molecule 1 [Dugong dugon]
MSGPGAMSGPKGDSLSVQCGYDPGWEAYCKWWCRGAHWGSCKILVKTTGSEQEVKKGRVSIRDSQKNRTFKVTMEKLREDDEDFYWCGIEKIGPDLGVLVKVSVGPALTTMRTTTTSTSTSTIFTASSIPEENRTSPIMTSQLSDVRPKILELSILIPLICMVLLLLLLATSLLAWRMVKQQKEAAGTSSEQPLEGELCYANLTLHRTGTSPVSSQKKASAKSASSAQANKEEAEYVTMDPLPREEISYASLSLDTSNQEPFYSNMD